MKKRLLIGTLILTIFLVGLIPVSVFAITSSGFSGYKILGNGEASYGEISSAVRATFILGVRGQDEIAIWGVGTGQITTQTQNLPPVISFIGGDDSDFGGFSRILWSFNLIDKTLHIIGIIGEARDSDVLALSGTVVGILGRVPRAAVVLYGTLSWQTEIVSLEIDANIFADAPNYDWMDL